MNFFDAVKHRRSIYAIGKEETVSRDKVRQIVEEAVLHTPSPFNSQTARVVVLFGEESLRFWKIVADALRPLISADAFGKTREKLDGFAGGYGTILFFEENAIVESLQAKFPLYADKFPVWSMQSNGMVEFVTWTALEEAGLGASLQHYNPVIDEAVREAWKLPASWKLYAEMPFGSVVAPAGEKEFQPVETRVSVYG